MNKLCLALALASLAAPCLAGPGNPGIVEVPASRLAAYSRVVAVSDVHGMFAPARKLLREVGVTDGKGRWAGGKTLLVVTGDSIDKGPQSLEVLALWMRLQKEAPRTGGQVIVLLGNHEAEMLADPVGDTKTGEVLAELKPLGLTVRDLVTGTADRPLSGARLSELRAFLHRLPAAARVGDWLFCHAGWVPAPAATGTPLSRWQGLVARTRQSVASDRYGPFLQGDGAEFLERKEFPEGTKWTTNPAAVRELERRLGGYGLRGAVFGHVPRAFGIEGEVGYSRPADRRLIKIDSGMAPEAGGHPGHIAIFPHPTELAGRPASEVHASSGGATTTPLAEGTTLPG